jgi:hypothetical protein
MLAGGGAIGGDISENPLIHRLPITGTGKDGT